MSVQDLVRIFCVADVDQSELEQILLGYFGGSHGISAEEFVYSHRGDSEPALRVKYSDDHGISAIEAGPTLLASDVDAIAGRINSDLIQPAPSQIGQTVLFSYSPITGFFRYKGHFQLLPPPDIAPRPPYAMGDHPVLLQFLAPGSPNMTIQMMRRARVGREIELLLAATTTQLRYAIGPVAQFHWSLVNAADPPNWRSEWCQEMYTWPDLSGVVTEFTPLAQYTAAPRVPATDYYNRVGFSVGTALDLPDELEHLLKTFYECSRHVQQQFLRASYWFQYAQRTAGLSRSGSYTALVSAIEAFTTDGIATGTCPTCKRATGISRTKAFADFVERYAPSPAISNTQRRQLYRVRSALSHGGRLLHTDQNLWGAMSSGGLSDWNDQYAMWQIVRVALVNWLHDQVIPLI